MNAARALACLSPLALALAGCAGAGAPPPRAVPLAPAWHDANGAARDANPAWWRRFGDDTLDRLIAAGLADNPDIAVALARVDQARALARHARADLLPSAQSQDSLARERQSIDSGLGRLTRYVPTIARTQNQADLGVSPSWDIDLAGNLRAEARARGAEAGSAQAGLAAARLAVAAEIAGAYLDWLGESRDLALLERDRRLAAERQAIAMARVQRGAASPVVRDEADAALAALDAALPAARAAPAVARNRLAVLLGRAAGADLPELSPGRDVPTADDPAAGVPADLLRHRPDLVMAEARLTASHARVGAALGEYWPKLNVSGLIGFSTTDLSTLGQDSASVVAGAIGLRWRLFDFARIDAEVAAARGAEREALAAYRGAVLQASGEVENAFLQLGAARAALAARDQAHVAQVDSLARARQAFARGQISRDTLLVSEDRALAAEREQLAARLALARALVGCHRSLGG